MMDKEGCLKAIDEFKAKNALEAVPEHIIATIHLRNIHGIDDAAALDQSSRGGSSEHGIDAWYYDDSKMELFVYQSKLTESKSMTLSGLKDLDDARLFLEQIIINGEIDKVPDNHCLYNLYLKLSNVRKTIKKINFSLISLFNKNELEDSQEYRDLEKNLIESKLNKHTNIKLEIDASEYNLDSGVPKKVKKYSIKKIPYTRINLGKNAHLDLAYIPLYDLVELYRQRGDMIFNKNIRLSITDTKKARERLVNPMRNTLNQITSGELDPNIFPFYHGGVTIAAPSSIEEEDFLNLQNPSIINGCQSIHIAYEYLKDLDNGKSKNNEVSNKAIERFKEIKVIAKVVIGTGDEELREITNSNNRQNPVENWQLFSNEPIHIEIENALKDIGIFYERQEGKFNTLMKRTENAKYYHSTNNAYIKVQDLGQVIALSKGNMQWGAKPSEIFLKKDNHDKIFDITIPRYPRDIVFLYNVYRAMKRGLNKYLEEHSSTYSNNEYIMKIFDKPNVRAHIFWLALLYYYQNEDKRSPFAEFSKILYKKASTNLVEDSQSFYFKIASKIRDWYLKESKNLDVEISARTMKEFFKELGTTELKIDFEEGAMPFSKKSVNWKQYLQEY